MSIPLSYFRYQIYPNTKFKYIYNAIRIYVTNYSTSIDSDGVVNVLKFGIGIDLVAEVTKWNTHFLDKFISNKNYIGEGWSLCTEAQFNEAATSFINHFLGIIAKKPD